MEAAKLHRAYCRFILLAQRWASEQFKQGGKSCKMIKYAGPEVWHAHRGLNMMVAWRRAGAQTSRAIDKLIVTLSRWPQKYIGS